MDLSKRIEVVLIDDDHVANVFNKHILENVAEVGHVITLSSGLEALEYMQQRVQRSPRIPELFFVDIHMPHMNGFQFIEKLENLLKLNGLENKTMINVLSSSDIKSDILKFVQMRTASKFISKPLTKDKITSVLDRLYTSIIPRPNLGGSH